METAFFLDLYKSGQSRSQEVCTVKHDQQMTAYQIDALLSEFAGWNEGIAKLYRSCTGPHLLARPELWSKGRRAFSSLFAIAEETGRGIRGLAGELTASGFTLENQSRFEASWVDILLLSDHLRQHWPSKRGEEIELRQGTRDVKQGRYVDAERLLNEIKNRPD